MLVHTEGTGAIPDEKIADLVSEHFDLMPRGIIDYLKLRRPVFRQTSYHGHFGRTGDGFTWEQTEKAEDLRRAAGL